MTFRLRQARLQLSRVDDPVARSPTTDPGSSQLRCPSSQGQGSPPLLGFRPFPDFSPVHQAPTARLPSSTPSTPGNPPSSNHHSFTQVPMDNMSFQDPIPTQQPNTPAPRDSSDNTHPLDFSGHRQRPPSTASYLQDLRRTSTDHPSASEESTDTDMVSRLRQLGHEASWPEARPFPPETSASLTRPWEDQTARTSTTTQRPRMSLGPFPHMLPSQPGPSSASTPGFRQSSPIPGPSVPPPSRTTTRPSDRQPSPSELPPERPRAVLPDLTRPDFGLMGSPSGIPSLPPYLLAAAFASPYLPWPMPPPGPDLTAFGRILWGNPMLSGPPPARPAFPAARPSTPSPEVVTSDRVEEVPTDDSSATRSHLPRDPSPVPSRSNTPTSQATTPTSQNSSQVNVSHLPSLPNYREIAPPRFHDPREHYSTASPAAPRVYEGEAILFRALLLNLVPHLKPEDYDQAINRQTLSGIAARYGGVTTRQTLQMALSLIQRGHRVADAPLDPHKPGNSRARRAQKRRRLPIETEYMISNPAFTPMSRSTRVQPSTRALVAQCKSCRQRFLIGQEHPSKHMCPGIPVVRRPH